MVQSKYGILSYQSSLNEEVLEAQVVQAGMKKIAGPYKVLIRSKVYLPLETDLRKIGT